MSFENDLMNESMKKKKHKLTKSKKEKVIIFFFRVRAIFKDSFFCRNKNNTTCFLTKQKVKTRKL